MREDHVIELRDVDGVVRRVTEGEAVRALALALQARGGSGDAMASAVLVPHSKIATLTIEPIGAKA